MAFQNLTENPQESTVVLTIIGLLLSKGLNATDIGVLGRIFIYLGEVLATTSVLMLAEETNENETDSLNIRRTLYELQQQNQYLQEQIWELKNRT